MSFEFDIEPIDNEAGDFHHRLSIELFKAFAQAKKDKGITQRKIAEIMGVDKSQVSRILRGIGNPTARTISDFAFALDCKPTLTLTPILSGGNREQNHTYGSLAIGKSYDVRVESPSTRSSVPASKSSSYSSVNQERQPA
jgi:transcriptional regulator with XRE-family HTH domain